MKDQSVEVIPSLHAKFLMWNALLLEFINYIFWGYFMDRTEKLYYHILLTFLTGFSCKKSRVRAINSAFLCYPRPRKKYVKSSRSSSGENWTFGVKGKVLTFRVLKSNPSTRNTSWPKLKFTFIAFCRTTAIIKCQIWTLENPSYFNSESSNVSMM